MSSVRGFFGGLLAAIILSVLRFDTPHTQPFALGGVARGLLTCSGSQHLPGQVLLHMYMHVAVWENMSDQRRTECVNDACREQFPDSGIVFKFCPSCGFRQDKSAGPNTQSSQAEGSVNAGSKNGVSFDQLKQQEPDQPPGDENHKDKVSVSSQDPGSLSTGDTGSGEPLPKLASGEETAPAKHPPCLVGRRASDSKSNDENGTEETKHTPTPNNINRSPVNEHRELGRTAGENGTEETKHPPTPSHPNEPQSNERREVGQTTGENGAEETNHILTPDHPNGSQSMPVNQHCEVGQTTGENGTEETNHILTPDHLNGSQSTPVNQHCEVGRSDSSTLDQDRTGEEPAVNGSSTSPAAEVVRTLEV